MVPETILTPVNDNALKGDVTRVSSASKYRFSGKETLWTPIETKSMKWTVQFRVNINEDNGEQNLRITHTLTADI
jgi:hypothetical protein